MDADRPADLFPPQVRLEFTDATSGLWLRNENGALSPKHVTPFRQDWSKVWRWKRNKTQTTKTRRLYTRWR